jgi:tetratricopeptide (TPR) repeat protein
VKKTLITLTLSLAVLACSAPAEQPKQAQPDERRTLCLHAVSGDTPAGRMLTAAQQKVRESDAVFADAWVDVGSGWAVEARDAHDPGAYVHATACADLALEADARHRGAQNLKLLAMLNDHRFAEARDLAEQMLRAEPSDQMTWGSLSDALLELGDVERAAEAAQKMVDLRPNLPSYARASYLAWLQGDVEGAKLYIREAHRAGRGQRLREPEAWVLTEAARIFWHEGDLDGAEAGFDLALQQRADYPDALVGKAQIEMARGENARAAALLSRAMELRPSTKTAWLLGDAHAAAGDARAAADARARVRAMGRGEDPLTYGLFLASTSDDLSELALAVELLGIEHARRAGIYTSAAYAFALAKAGQADKAQPLVDEVVKLGTPDAELISRAAFVRAAAGRVDEARALKAKATSLNPHAARS